MKRLSLCLMSGILLFPSHVAFAQVIGPNDTAINLSTINTALDGIKDIKI
ncbi:MAG: hypothetical protein LBI53_06705 [Candidatus Peribacteria bacterium]|jgi:hypothetical protein|nr:hypothetical protein [Candidatus Peribacteria bacterium]